jgi:hypothetical protein
VLAAHSSRFRFKAYGDEELWRRTVKLKKRKVKVRSPYDMPMQVQRVGDPALEGGGWSAHTSAALPPGKTRYPLYRRLGGRRGWPGRHG